MAKKTVKLKKYVDIINEYVAAAEITPGMLLELTSAGEVQPHSVAGGNAARIFALEDELQGNGLGDNYAAGDPVQCWMPVPGEEVFAILADGEDVDESDYLESAGNGYLQKHVMDSGGEIHSHQIVAQAMEHLNISSSSGVESSGEGTIDDTIGYARRIKVRIV